MTPLNRVAAFVGREIALVIVIVIAIVWLVGVAISSVNHQIPANDNSDGLAFGLLFGFYRIGRFVGRWFVRTVAKRA
jgi:low affinity Fe/Cu permease